MYEVWQPRTAFDRGKYFIELLSVDFKPFFDA